MDSPRVDDELVMVLFDPRRKFCLDIETEGSIPAEEDKINSNSERWIPGDQVFFENEQSPLFSPPTTGCTRIADGSFRTTQGRGGYQPKSKDSFVIALTGISRARKRYVKVGTTGSVI
jgi:hypothetical protein